MYETWVLIIIMLGNSGRAEVELQPFNSELRCKAAMEMLRSQDWSVDVDRIFDVLECVPK